MSAGDEGKRVRLVSYAVERFQAWERQADARQSLHAPYQAGHNDIGLFVEACADVVVARRPIGGPIGAAHASGGNIEAVLLVKWELDDELDARYAEMVLWLLALRTLRNMCTNDDGAALDETEDESLSDDESSSYASVTCSDLMCWCIANYYTAHARVAALPQSEHYAVLWSDASDALSKAAPSETKDAIAMLDAPPCQVQLTVTVPDSGNVDAYSNLLVRFWSTFKNERFASADIVQESGTTALRATAWLTPLGGGATDDAAPPCVLLLDGATPWCEQDLLAYHANVLTLLQYGRTAKAWLSSAPSAVRKMCDAIATSRELTEEDVAKTWLEYSDTPLPDDFKDKTNALKSYVTGLLQAKKTDPVLDVVMLGALGQRPQDLQRPYGRLLQHCTSRGALPAPQWLCAVGALPLLLKPDAKPDLDALYMQVEINVLHGANGQNRVKDRLSNVYACEARRCYEMARCYARDLRLFQSVHAELAKGATGAVLIQRLGQVMSPQNYWTGYFAALSKARQPPTPQTAEGQADMLLPFYLLTLQTLPLVEAALTVVGQGKAPDTYVTTLLREKRAIDVPATRFDVDQCTLSPVVHTTDAAMLPSLGYKATDVTGSLRVMGCAMLHYEASPPALLPQKWKQLKRILARPGNSCALVFIGSNADEAKSAMHDFRRAYPHCAMPCTYATDASSTVRGVEARLLVRQHGNLMQATLVIDHTDRHWPRRVLHHLGQSCLPEVLRSAPRAVVVMDAPAGGGVYMQYKDCARIVDAAHSNVALEPCVQDDFWGYARACGDFVRWCGDEALMARLSTCSRRADPGGGAAAAGEVKVLPRCIVAPTSTMHWLGVRRPPRHGCSCWGPHGDLALPGSSDVVGSSAHADVLPLTHATIRVNGNFTLDDTARGALNQTLHGGHVLGRLQASIYTDVLKTHQDRGCMVHGYFMASCEYCMMTRMQDDAEGMAPVHWSALGVRQQYDHNFATAVLAQPQQPAADPAMEHLATLCGRADLSRWHGNELACANGGATALFEQDAAPATGRSNKMLGVTPALHAHNVLATMPRVHAERAAAWDFVTEQDAELFGAYGMPRARLRALRDVAYQVMRCWQLSGTCVLHKRRYTAQHQNRKAMEVPNLHTLLLPHILTPKAVLTRGADLVPIIARTKEDVLHADLMWAQACTNNDGLVSNAVHACRAYVADKDAFTLPKSWMPLLYDPKNPDVAAPFYYCFERQHGARADTYGAIPALYSRDAAGTYTSNVTLHASRYNAFMLREDRGAIMTFIANVFHAKVTDTRHGSQDLCRSHVGEPSVAFPRVALINGTTAKVEVVEQVLRFHPVQNSCTLKLRDEAHTHVTVFYGALQSALPCTDVFERLLWEYNLTANAEGPLVPPLQRSDGGAARRESLQVYGRVLDIADAGAAWPVVSEADKLHQSDADDVTAHLSPSNVHALLCHNPTYLQYAADDMNVCTVVDRGTSTHFAYGMEGKCEHAAEPFESADEEKKRWRPCRLLVGSAREEPVCSASSMAVAQGYLAEALPLQTQGKRKATAMALHAQVGCFVVPYESEGAHVRCQEREKPSAKRSRTAASAAAGDA